MVSDSSHDPDGKPESHKQIFIERSVGFTQTPGFWLITTSTARLPLFQYYSIVCAVPASKDWDDDDLLLHDQLIQ